LVFKLTFLLSSSLKYLYHFFFGLFTVAMATIATTIRIATTRAALIQIGDKTHSQDQLITLQSLRTIKATVNKPVKPIPELDADELLFLLNVYLLSHRILVLCYFLFNFNHIAVWQEGVSCISGTLSRVRREPFPSSNSHMIIRSLFPTLIQLHAHIHKSWSLPSPTAS
jgi:hypothetical protein